MEQYYRHFKGNIYRVLHIAKHSETLEDMVVYQAMYGKRGIWVRPPSMFEEVIERDGKTFRRFSPPLLQRRPRRKSISSNDSYLARGLQIYNAYNQFGR